MAFSKRKLAFVVVVAAFLIAAPVSSTVQVANAAQRGHIPVTICHKGNQDPPSITITIDIRALPMHMLLHGDTIGACDAPPPCPPDICDLPGGTP